MQANSDFDTLLKKQWDDLYQNRSKNALFKSDLEGRKFKDLGENFKAVYIEGLSEGKRKSVYKEESSSKVYQEFDESKFNFNKINEEEVLFYVNFDMEEVVTKERKEVIESENMEDALEEEISQSTLHPIILNPSPMMQRHCLISPFCEEELPQVIGTEMISTIFQIFKMAESPDLRIGFNSIGAFSSVNHLHFQCVYTEDFMEKRKFPVELKKRRLILSTSLINPKDEINMYSVGVNIFELEDHIVRGFVVTALKEDSDALETFNSLSFVTGTITNMLLEKDIPHNILLTSKSVFIFPRKHQSETKSTGVYLAWLELSGLIFCWDKEAFEKTEIKNLRKTAEEEVSLDEVVFENLKKEIKALFSATFLPE